MNIVLAIMLIIHSLIAGGVCFWILRSEWKASTPAVKAWLVLCFSIASLVVAAASLI